MSRLATVNYHVRSPDRPTYRIDAGGIVGKLVSPEHAATRVEVKDVRGGEASVTFARDGVAFETAPTDVVSFSADEVWRPAYDGELVALLQASVGAREVIVFDHTVRVDDPSASRQPARNVHADYSPDGAHQRLLDIVGEHNAVAWSRGHYAFVNLWRPIGQAINSAPLGFVRPASVAREDWMLIDLVYPDRMGHIMGLSASERHEWIYRSAMTPDEVVYFNIYDNRGLPSIGHSAMDLTEDETVHSIRRSIESRTLVRY